MIDSASSSVSSAVKDGSSSSVSKAPGDPNSWRRACLYVEVRTVEVGQHHQDSIKISPVHSTIVRAHSRFGEDLFESLARSTRPSCIHRQRR